MKFRVYFKHHDQMNRQLSLNIPLKINMKISGMYQDGTTFIKAMLKEKNQNKTAH